MTIFFQRKRIGCIKKISNHLGNAIQCLYTYENRDKGSLILNYLVTGAGGFIGGAVVTALVKAGHSVVTIDNFSTGFRGQIPGGVEVIEGNCYEELVIKKLSGIKLDAIMHIAGQSSGEVSFDDPVYDLQTNVQSTVMLMKHALSICL